MDESTRPKPGRWELAFFFMRVAFHVLLWPEDARIIIDKIAEMQRRGVSRW